jgi:hypothetical protein
MSAPSPGGEMTLDDMRVILEDVRVPEFFFAVFGTESECYLQGSYMEADIATSQLEGQHTRKWKLFQHMTKSELVQTAFKCYLTSMEHRAREHFKYKGKRIFGPHFDVEALVGICNQLDYRK